MKDLQHSGKPECFPTKIGKSYHFDSILEVLCLAEKQVKAIVFPVVMYRCESWTIISLSAKELILLNCGTGEDSRESLGQQGGPSGPS